MVKTVYVGTVVANSSQEKAITSFLKTVNVNEKNKKAIFSVTAGSNKVFLTNTETMFKPMSPTNGRASSTLVTDNHSVIASSLKLPSTNEITAKGNFSLASCTCPECNNTIVADNKALLKYCIVCGEEQDLEEEQDENIGLAIVDDDYDYEDTVSSDEEYEDEEDFSDLEVEDFDDDAMYSSDSEYENDEIDEIDDEELDSLLEDESLSSDEEEEIDEEEIDEFLANYDEDEYEDDIDESELDAMRASDCGEDEYCDEDFSDLDVDDDEIDAMLSSEDFDEDEYEDLSEDTEDELVETLSSAIALANDEVDFDVNLEDLDDEELVATVDDIGIEDQMEVDLVEDNLDDSTSIANSTVNLVYVPSEMVANHRWYAIINGAPVAVATVHSVGEQKSEIFASDTFRKATETLMAQIGIPNALKDMGFQSLKIKLPVKQIVASNVAKATKKIQAESKSQVENIREDLRSALATASVGINKGFFSKLSNPIKVQLFNVLSNAGVKNAELLIDDAFMEASDMYHKTLLTQAFELLSKSVDARNEISNAVMTASYQRANSIDDTSLSSSLSKQLSTIGKTQSMVASQNEVQPSFNQRASAVMQSFSR